MFAPMCEVHRSIPDRCYLLLQCCWQVCVFFIKLHEQTSASSYCGASVSGLEEERASGQQPRLNKINFLLAENNRFQVPKKVAELLFDLQVPVVVS